MITIRMARAGSKKRPFYHIVVADSRAPRDGRYIERLGFYNPSPSGQDESIKLNVERVDYWLGQGAKASDSVAKIIKDNAKATTAG